MSKVIKQMEMEALKGHFKDVRDMVVLSTKGLSCQGDYLFRAGLRKKKIYLKVVKNSLARRIFKDLGIHIPESSTYWAGPTTVAIGAGSIAQLSREIETELKSPKNGPLYKDKVTIKGAVADGTEVTFDVALKMPTRDEAIARVVMLALAPASRLLGQITGPASSLSSQIKSVSEKPENAPAAAPPA